jgi:DNA processing protein
VSALPAAAYAAALAGFERMSLHRLLALLRHHSPLHAFEIAAGTADPPSAGLIAKVLAQDEVREAWVRSARRDPAEVWERCVELGVEVTHLGHPDHPAILVADPLPPPVLFTKGDRGLLDGRRVALVGTRNATAAGRHVARTFGDGLAQAGVHVVSGLARGIDGHAHAGALEAVHRESSGRPIAVVASGLDVVYPLEHRRLWREVGEVGLLLSESPPGAAPVAHMFPQRNRLIAALSEIVVVVESRERGGSLITASLAAERGVPVMAVPGSATSRAALGVNALLRDGSPPAVDVADVLMALSIDHRRAGGETSELRPRPRRDDVGVYRACVERSSTIGELVERTGRPLVEVAMALARLEQAGWLDQVDGWFEPVGRPLSA